MLRYLRTLRLFLLLCGSLLLNTAGGGGSGGTGGDPAGGGDPNAGKPPEGGKPADAEHDGAGWDDRTRAYVERLRGEAAAGRTAKRDAETAVQTAAREAAEKAAAEEREKLAKALGLTDTPPDPAKLAAEVATKDRTVADKDRALKARDLELAAWRAADRAGVKAGALLDSRSFMAELAKLDPAADDFPAKLDAAVKTAADANPHYRQTGQVPGSGGADLNAGGTGVVRPTPTLDSALAAVLAPKP